MQGQIHSFRRIATLASELEDHFDLNKWLRELEKYCEYKGKSSASQLRLQEKVRHHVSLANRDRTETNLDDELTTKFDNKQIFQISLENTAAGAFTEQLSIDLAGSISQTKEKESSLTTASEATLQRVPQIQLCRDSFKQLALQEQWTTNSFQETACSSSLSTKALDSNNFQDSSLTEETFSKATSKKTPWKKRPSARQLQRPQLDEENFAESSLHGTLPSQLGRQRLERHFAFAASQTAAWQLSFEQPSFQTRTSTTEFAQLQATSLHLWREQLHSTASEKQL